jgi:Queuosine salvage protein
MALLDEVRARAAFIAAHARSVAIEYERVPAYARGLPIDAARAPRLDPMTHYSGAADDTLAFVVTLDAINFGSGYFPRLRKRPGMSGYFTLASSLKDHFEAHGPLTPAQLQALTGGQCAAVFGQTLDDPAVVELMGLFAQALNDLGRYAAATGFRALVDRARGSAERLVAVLAEMPYYRDVPFYKRAQLTAADLHTAGVALFDDLDRLTIFADNLVPHVLRVDGILRYSDDLLVRINREELIAAGSDEEMEIRACALHAVELMVGPLNAMQLDYVLWNRGQAPMYKAQPRHRTRSVYY